MVGLQFVTHTRRTFVIHDVTGGDSETLDRLMCHVAPVFVPERMKHEVVVPHAVWFGL